MNKVSLIIVIVCSVIFGKAMGQLIYAPETMNGIAWFSAAVNAIAVIISSSNVVRFGLRAS
jgi:hypothetical protein